MVFSKWIIMPFVITVNDFRLFLIWHYWRVCECVCNFSNYGKYLLLMTISNYFQGCFIHFIVNLNKHHKWNLFSSCTNTWKSGCLCWRQIGACFGGMSLTTWGMSREMWEVCCAKVKQVWGNSSIWRNN